MPRSRFPLACTGCPPPVGRTPGSRRQQRPGSRRASSVTHQSPAWTCSRSPPSAVQCARAGEAMRGDRAAAPVLGRPPIVVRAAGSLARGQCSRVKPTGPRCGRGGGRTEPGRWAPEPGLPAAGLTPLSRFCDSANGTRRHTGMASPQAVETRSPESERRRLSLLVKVAASAGDFSPKLAVAVDHATDSEVRVMSDLVERGMSIPDLVGLLQGAHVLVGDDDLYERWIFPTSRRRMSSHHRTVDKKRDPGLRPRRPAGPRVAARQGRGRDVGAARADQGDASSGASCPRGPTWCTSATTSSTGSRGRTSAPGGCRRTSTPGRCCCAHRTRPRAGLPVRRWPRSRVGAPT